jgi:hypothetical protein
MQNHPRERDSCFLAPSNPLEIEVRNRFFRSEIDVLYRSFQWDSIGFIASGGGGLRWLPGYIYDGETLKQIRTGISIL